MRDTITCNQPASRKAIRHGFCERNQSQSVSISRSQSQSVAINQSQSIAINCNHLRAWEGRLFAWLLMREAICMQPESGMSMQAEGGHLHATREGATVAPPLFTSGSQISRSLAPRSSRSRSRRSEALASGIADSTCGERRVGRRAERLHAKIRGARFGDCVEHQGCEETSVPGL